MVRKGSPLDDRNFPYHSYAISLAFSPDDYNSVPYPDTLLCNAASHLSDVLDGIVEEEYDEEESPPDALYCGSSMKYFASDSRNDFLGLCTTMIQPGEDIAYMMVCSISREPTLAKDGFDMVMDILEGMGTVTDVSHMSGIIDDYKKECLKLYKYHGL